MKALPIDLTTEDLKMLFEYDDRNKEQPLIWRRLGRRNVKEGLRAGTLSNNRYFHVSVYNKLYLLHRLVWLWHGYELDTEKVIDHINRNKVDNRIENLRQIYKQQNERNGVRNSLNKSGHSGVFRCHRDISWKVEISKGILDSRGKMQIVRKSFNDKKLGGKESALSEAVAFSKKVYKELGYTETHGTLPTEEV